MTTPKLIITPRRPALLSGHDNQLEVLVRVQAPPAPEVRTTRNPLHLALVIDRSGSMSGQPLQEAKRCAEFVLDGLNPADRLSLIVYDNHVQTLLPAVHLHDKEAARRAIRSIDSGGSTNLHGGWFQGVETLAPHTRANVTSRVILLSDGCANHGLTDEGRIFEQCAELARSGVSTSTYGLGGNFNEDLMIGMARHGQGNSYYGQTAEDLMDPFHEEFELLNALYARRPRLEVMTAAGIDYRMLNDYVADGANAWLLPNLAFDGEAWAVVRLRIPNAKTQPGAVVDLGAFSVTYATVDGESRATGSQPLALEALPASAFNAIAEDELVVRRTGELKAAELQGTARAAARRGDWPAVELALKRAERVATDNPWVASSLKELRELAALKDQEIFSKESAFASRRMSTRLASVNESAIVGASPAGAAYLRRKTRQGKSEQEDTPKGDQPK
jgi:Ca-activated chloride channel homolog